eukprot:3881648-Rhodomonas_salina.3
MGGYQRIRPRAQGACLCSCSVFAAPVAVKSQEKGGVRRAQERQEKEGSGEAQKRSEFGVDEK